MHFFLEVLFHKFPPFAGAPSAIPTRSASTGSTCGPRRPASGSPNRGGRGEDGGGTPSRRGRSESGGACTLPSLASQGEHNCCGAGGIPKGIFSYGEKSPSFLPASAEKNMCAEACCKNRVYEHTQYGRKILTERRRLPSNSDPPPPPPQKQCLS